MKRYIVKVYNKDLSYQRTLRDDVIMSEVEYDFNINWWQSELNILLNVDFSNTDVIQSDIVKVYLYDDNNKTWRLLYTWIVEEVNRYYKESENKLELVCRSLSSLLTRVLYKDWVNYTFTKNTDPSTIITEIVNYFNTQYSWNLLNTSWITNYWTNINIEFDYTLCLDAINDIVELTDFFFLIKEDWTVIFKQKNINYDHQFTSWYDLQNLNINEDASEIINKVIVTWDNTWTDEELIVLDNTSITNSWLFEKHFNKTDLKDLTSATAFANEELNKNKNKKQKIELEINDRYLIETIYPWDIISISNINYPIKNIQVAKIWYNSKSITIYLEQIDSIWKILIKK